ncbi:MAG: hypothetical protein Q4G33_06920 [bacterium]|nr:hypothetical protein [bacterium]
MNYYGNLAYDDRDYEDYSPEYRKNKQVKSSDIKRNKSTMKGKAKNKTGKTARKTARAKNKKINAGVIASILALSVSAAFMISEFVTVNERRDEIAGLEEKLANAEAATSQKSFELEQSVDLTEIEKEATTRLGMQRPEKYQTIYINVPTDDVTHTTAGAVEGVDNSLKNFFNKIFSDIIEFFSIK